MEGGRHPHRGGASTAEHSAKRADTTTAPQGHRSDTVRDVGDWVLALAAIAGAIVLGIVIARVVRGRSGMGSAGDMATYRTLHIASLAAPGLRGGLTTAAAQRSVQPPAQPAGRRGPGDHRPGSRRWPGTASASGAGRPQPGMRAPHWTPARRWCSARPRPARSPSALRSGVAAPLTSDDVVIGALVAYTTAPAGPGLMRAVEEVATFASGQLDLAELDRTRARTAEAEVRVLRAQISPHFIYNSLTAIASFVRTDPDRARDLLLDFAEFTRYSFRSHGRYTTLAEELHSIEQYLLLEQARFGERLQVRCGWTPRCWACGSRSCASSRWWRTRCATAWRTATARDTSSITALERGGGRWISVEDDGVGNDPAVIRRSLSGEPGDHVGLANVDERLRTAFGDDHGLVVETAPMAGTKVTHADPQVRRGGERR